MEIAQEYLNLILSFSIFQHINILVDSITDILVK